MLLDYEDSDVISAIHIKDYTIILTLSLSLNHDTIVTFPLEILVDIPTQSSASLLSPA